MMATHRARARAARRRAAAAATVAGRAAPGPALWRPGKVALVGGSALVLAALLNSASLLDLAEQQPEGSRVRSVALAVAEPLDDVASAVGLDRAARGRRRVAGP